MDQSGQNVLLQRFLKILVSHNNLSEHLDLQLDFLQKRLRVELGGVSRGIVPLTNDGEGAPLFSLLVDVASSGLEETADEDDLEQLVGVLEVLEGGTSGDELGGEGIVIGGRYRVKER